MRCLDELLCGQYQCSGVALVTCSAKKAWFNSTCNNMASSLERKGAIEKIKRVQVDGLVREGPSIGTFTVCSARFRWR